MLKTHLSIHTCRAAPSKSGPLRELLPHRVSIDERIALGRRGGRLQLCAWCRCDDLFRVCVHPPLPSAAVRSGGRPGGNIHKVRTRLLSTLSAPTARSVLVSPGTLAAVEVYVWLTYFQFSSMRYLSYSVVSDSKLLETSRGLGTGGPAAWRHPRPRVVFYPRARPRVVL